ncbi:MAG TPA: hypothetical protein IAA26_13410 [Candidatus Blautia faecipullorum]|nr:hypothetical protein [Candidatus Blautia faecipullorum]
MNSSKSFFIKRCIMMLTGILFISICVGCFRLSAFGVDAFTCMNLGISGYLGMSFGTWQLIMNAGILVVVFFTVRKCIGAGTIVNMVCVGYGADFICWIVQDVFKIHMSLPLRIAALIVGCLFAGLGVAFYMVAEMGIAPYDSVALIIEKATRGKIPFQYARVLSDVTVVVIGVVFCLMAGNDLWLIIGIGTLCNAFFNGPLIQFFKTHISEPLLKK